MSSSLSVSLFYYRTEIAPFRLLFSFITQFSKAIFPFLCILFPPKVMPFKTVISIHAPFSLFFIVATTIYQDSTGFYTTG